MHTATLTVFTLVLLSATPAGAVVERADTVATYIGGFGEHPISGDGSRVVFTDFDDDEEVYVWEQEIGSTRITDESNKPGINSVWSIDVDFDGTAIAAIALGDLAGTGATGWELYRWTEESGWEGLTFNSQNHVSLDAVAISDDGRRIAFISTDDYTGQNPVGEEQLFLWEEGAGFTQVTHGVACGPGDVSRLVDLSGDGRRILFQSRCQFGSDNDDGNYELFLWDETVGVRALTATKNVHVHATGQLNRDGTIAALISGSDLTGHGPDDGYHRLYRWVDRRGFERLTKHPTSGFYQPAISADGSRIVYGARNGQGTDEINPEGTQELFFWQQGLPDVAALTDSGQTDFALGNGFPHLSADGTRVSMRALGAFDAPADLRTGHYVIDVLSPQEARPNLLANGSFDTGLGGWALSIGAEFSPEDGKADPASGSALQPNDQPSGGVSMSSITQCVALAPDTEYVISALLRVVPGTNTGSARVGVRLYPTKNCSGLSYTPLTPAATGRDDGAWIGAHGRFVTTPDTVSARVLLFTTKDEDGGYLEAGFDDVDLRLDNEVKVLP